MIGAFTSRPTRRGPQSCASGHSAPTNATTTSGLSASSASDRSRPWMSSSEKDSISCGPISAAETIESPPMTTRMIHFNSGTGGAAGSARHARHETRPLEAGWLKALVLLLFKKICTSARGRLCAGLKIRAQLVLSPPPCWAATLAGRRWILRCVPPSTGSGLASRQRAWRRGLLGRPCRRRCSRRRSLRRWRSRRATRFL